MYFGKIFSSSTYFELRDEGDRTENVLWLHQIQFPEQVRALIILVGTNSVAVDSPQTISDGITCGGREACSKVKEFLRKFSISSIFNDISYMPPK